MAASNNYKYHSIKYKYVHMHKIISQYNNIINNTLFSADIIQSSFKEFLQCIERI
jgi:hypothetical protein